MSKTESPTITIEAFRAQARNRLLSEPPLEAFDPNHLPPLGDHRLAENLAPADGRLHRPAAVLVPIVAHRAGATVLLTERSAQLKDHAGQIAFPGGKIDATDEDAAAAALREAEEEIGLHRHFVEPLGYLDPYLSSTGYRIMPLVGIVTPGFSLTLDKREVESAFEVPLSFLMDPARHEIHQREWRGAQRRYFAMPYEGRYIWGVTAGIIRSLYERLYAP
jgi:8-oxo-dGTP pyrophosphatase MutT (NUDIX family)